MDDYYQTFRACVLFTRPYKEKDLLIKLFTEPYGKRMFFIRNVRSPKNALRTAAFPFARGEFIGHINVDGLSFLDQVNSVQLSERLQTDITYYAHAAYIAGLIDAALDDGVQDPTLFRLTWEALRQLDALEQPAIITNIIELQLLPTFGVPVQLDHCVICGRQRGPFDFSVRYNGLLCARHFDLDSRRLHWAPNTTEMIRRLQRVDLGKLRSIHVSEAMERALRRAIDELYSEYVGLHLKSKTFLDHLSDLDRWYEK